MIDGKEPLDEVRFVFTGGISAIMTICAEMMMRYGGNKTTPDKQVFVGVSVLNGQPAVMFSNPRTRRHAWVTPKQYDGYLVWFADGKEKDQVIELDERNVVPNNMTCRSTIYLRPNGVTQVIEEFMLEGKISENAMPAGHLQTLTG